MSPTYYDFVLRLRPYIVEAAERDAERLLNRTNPPVAISSSDEFDSSIAEVMQKTDQELVQRMAETTGYSVEVIQRHLPDVLAAARSQAASLYMTMNMEYHCLLNFALSGKRVFTFSDNLSEHLANTELNVKADMIRLPFPSCMFHFTSPAFVNTLYNLNGDQGRRQINQQGVDYSAPVSAFLTMLPAAPLPGQKLLIVAFHAKQPNKSYMATKREIYLGEGWSLEQALRTDWEKLTPDDLGPGLTINVADDTVEGQGSERFYTDGFAFFRAVLNAILYVGSEHAELIPERSGKAEIETIAKGIQSAPKRRKKLQEAARHSALDHTVCGPSVGPILIKRDSAPQGESSGVSSGTKPNIRIMVRGHWKMQRYGQGLSESKLLRIEPYYRGPEMADLVSKPYLVK